jgi:hypothetical protein
MEIHVVSHVDQIDNHFCHSILFFWLAEIFKVNATKA